MAYKLIGSRVEAINGEPCVILIADGVEVIFPARGLTQVYLDTQMKLDAFEAQTGIKTPEWRKAIFRTPRSIQTGTTDDGRVAVMFDPGLPTELTIALSSDHASELGQELMATAKQADLPPKAN